MCATLLYCNHPSSQQQTEAPEMQETIFQSVLDLKPKFEQRCQNKMPFGFSVHAILKSPGTLSQTSEVGSGPYIDANKKTILHSYQNQSGFLISKLHFQPVLF